MRTNNYSSTFFSKAVPLLVLLSFSTGAAAEVFKCVDKATGKMSFTDKACPNDQPGARHSVSPTNTDTGYNSEAVASAKEKRKLDEREFRDGWQSHNDEVQEKQVSEEIIKDREKRQRQWEWDHRENANNGYDGHNGHRYQTTRPTRAN